MLDYPRVFFVFSFLTLWIAAVAGSYLRKLRPLNNDERSDFDLVQTAILTLLALIIGFSFSMATTRYDLRKNYEEGEANADWHGVCPGRAAAARHRPPGP